MLDEARIRRQCERGARENNFQMLCQRSFFLAGLLVAACAPAPLWRAQSIPADSPFHSGRLVYQAPHSPLTLEFLRHGETIQAFLCCRSARPLHPVKITLVIEGEKLTEFSTPRKGGMRFPLSESLAQALISGLQVGKPVSILIGDISEVFSPQSFASTYAKFLEGESLLAERIKDPF